MEFISWQQSNFPPIYIQASVWNCSLSNRKTLNSDFGLRWQRGPWVCYLKWHRHATLCEWITPDSIRSHFTASLLMPISNHQGPVTRAFCTLSCWVDKMAFTSVYFSSVYIRMTHMLPLRSVYSKCVCMRAVLFMSQSAEMTVLHQLAKAGFRWWKSPLHADG